MYVIMNIPISQKRALLVGINYLKTPNARLYGCINDVVNTKKMLTEKFGYDSQNITLLRDDDILALPTRNNIMNQLNTIVASSTNTTETWIHYSGHGAQILDTDNDESDSLDEIIVPSDYPISGIISDDELFSAISKIKGRVLLFFDSCHSATVCDLQYSREYKGGEFVKTVNNRKYIANPNIIMMSGSRDNQTSADTYNPVTKQAVGAFTDKLLEAFSVTPEKMDLLKVYNTVCFNLSKSGYEQFPIFSTSSDRIQYLYGSKIDLGPNSFGALPPPPPPPPKPPVTFMRPPPPSKPTTPPKIQMSFSGFLSYLMKPTKPQSKPNKVNKKVSNPSGENIYFKPSQSKISRPMFGLMDKIIRTSQ